MVANDYSYYFYSFPRSTEPYRHRIGRYRDDGKLRYEWLPPPALFYRGGLPVPDRSHTASAAAPKGTTWILTHFALSIGPPT